MNKFASICSIAFIGALCACSGSKGWKVNGQLANAPEGSKIAIEGFNGARWYCIDSVDVAKNGSFSFAAQEGSAFPDVYRIGYNGRSIYFPIDSVDQVSITADAVNFDRGYKLEGTSLASQMMEADAIVASFQNGNSGVNPDSALKAQLNQLILADSVGVIAYYLINKTIDGHALYNVSDKKDLRMIGALANKFASLRPDDPRTSVLSQRYISGRRNAGLTTGVSEIAANEVDLFDISLYNPKGELKSLAEVAANKPVVILSFTAYGLETSPAYNALLNELYQNGKAKGLEIYQVGFDANEVDWNDAAANLPWVAVHSLSNTSQDILRKYNVGALPMTYIIKNGSLVERVIDPKELSAAMAKYM